MRKITQEATQAFYQGISFSKANTSVTHSHDSTTDQTELRLHGNIIAKTDHKTNTTYISLSGWNTNTTRERLNGLNTRYPVRIHTKNGQAYLNNQPIDDNTFYKVN